MPDTDRIAVIDFTRGVAVMGILLANLPAFALPEAAYFSPLAWGGTAPLDIVAWFVTFVLVEGKMRGLFSLLFGASLLLVHDRAAGAGENVAAVQLRRMAVLFVIGCLHLYLVWWGDILAHYALCGTIALALVHLRARWLVALAIAFAGWDLIVAVAGAAALFASAPGDAVWRGFSDGFGVPPPTHLVAEIAAMRGGFAEGVAWRWQHAFTPLGFLAAVGPQTLSAMLLGMAAYRSGFVTGAWSRAAYRRTALLGLGVTLPLYAATATITLHHGFDQRWVYLGSIVIGDVLRLPATLGYAALIVLLFNPAGTWSRRVTAVGRAAFTNYLGASLIMVLLFNGLAQFGAWPRAILYLLVPPAFALMLLWSAPWLAHHRYGPLEWLWRSAARGKVQS